MNQGTLDQLIDDVEKANKNINFDLPYNLHGFLHDLTENGLMVKFEIFLRDYRRTRNGD